MTNRDVAQMLHLFRQYWPTFEVQPRDGSIPGTVDAWCSALEIYSADDAMEALFQFRGQSDRTFAPTLSEFEGKLREFRNEKASRMLTLPTPSSKDGETLEHYEYNTSELDSKGNPKKRFALRATKMAREQYHKFQTEMLGLEKRRFELAPGVFGYEYRRP